VNADAKTAMQDVCYSALHHREFATSEEMLAALMPHVERYVAARAGDMAAAYQARIAAEDLTSTEITILKIRIDTLLALATGDQS